MNWLLAALLAPAVYAVNVFIDKYLLEKEIKDYRGLPVFTGIVGFVLGVILWFGFGMPVVNFRDTTLILLSGMFTVWGLATYFKALTVIQASLVNLFLQTAPVFVLILSFFLLNEDISIKQSLGFILIFIPSILGSIEGNILRFKFSSSFWWIMVSNILFSLSVIIIKFALEANTFAKIIIFESFGVGIGGLILFVVFVQIRKAFYKNLEKSGNRILGVVFFNEMLYVVAKGLNYFAFSIGPVALVSVISGTQVFYGFLYGWVLTIIFPRVFKENITTKNLVKNLILSIFVLFGIWLVSQ